jgi:uncharacterized phage protein (TIGR01671 family)
MREIKFRAWLSWDEAGRNMGKMIFTELREFKRDIGFLASDDMIQMRESKSFMGVYWTQHTGLNDKNWEGIYEGDIVQNFEPDNFVIEYSNGSFWCVGYSKGKPIVDMFEPYILSSKAVESEQLEIIGNIYENPELLS